MKTWHLLHLLKQQKEKQKKIAEKLSEENTAKEKDVKENSSEEENDKGRMSFGDAISILANKPKKK